VKLYYVAHLMLTAFSFTLTADPPPAPKVDPIRLPITPAPAPTPAPTPGAATSLAADQLYVIDSDIPCIVLTSPTGIVLVTEDSGPVKIRGKFVDGTGKAESRSYKGKAVYTVEAIASGRVELLIVPIGGAVGDVIRRTLDVTVGQGPQPPPKPTPTPDPAPMPVALWGFVIIEETADAVAARGALIADPNLSALMKSKGYHWRIVDKDVVSADGKPPADVLPCLNATKGKALPQVLLIDTKGNIVTQTGLANAAGLVDFLKKWGY
jgi:hypothetical protein